MDELGNYLHDDLVRVGSGPDHTPMVTGCLDAFAVQGSYEKLVEVASGSSQKAP